MMKLVEELVARAQAADSRMSQIADKEEKATARRQAYAKLEQVFDSMCSDGKLTRQEVEQLMTQFKAQGLDTGTLDEIYRQLKDADGSVKVDSSMRNKISEQLQDAKFNTNDPNFYFEAQDLMAQYQQSFDLASRVSKTEHEAYMTAIKHLVA